MMIVKKLYRILYVLVLVVSEQQFIMVRMGCITVCISKVGQRLYTILHTS